MSRPIVAIDVDDTLFDENTAVRLFHNEKYGTKHTAEDYQIEGKFFSFWEHIWQTDAAETDRRYEEFIKYKLQHHLSPLPGAFEVLQALKGKYELVIITSRDERGVQITQEAVAAHYPDLFNDVHFVALWTSRDSEKTTKAHVCQDIGAAYLIDDSFENCEPVAELGIETLLFGDYGWNRAQSLKPHMTRVKDWNAVRKYFDARG